MLHPLFLFLQEKCVIVDFYIYYTKASKEKIAAPYT